MSSKNISDQPFKMVEEEILSNWTFSGFAFDYCLAGIDFNLAGNGGPDCSGYISFERRCLEAVVALALCIAATFVGWKIHQPPKVKIIRSVETNSFQTPIIISDRPKPEFKPKTKYRNFGLV
jgi:hypothetical protein